MELIVGLSVTLGLKFPFRDLLINFDKFFDKLCKASSSVPSIKTSSKSASHILSIIEQRACKVVIKYSPKTSAIEFFNFLYSDYNKGGAIGFILLLICNLSPELQK